MGGCVVRRQRTAQVYCMLAMGILMLVAQDYDDQYEACQ